MIRGIVAPFFRWFAGFSAAFALGHALCGELSGEGAGDGRDWCGLLSGKPGVLLRDAGNPWLQGLHVEGQLRYQVAYLDGEDVSGRGWSQRFNEFRRVRLVARADFLRYFHAIAKMDLVHDHRNGSGGGKLDWGCDGLNAAVIGFDLGKAFGSGPFDSLVASYGRQKFMMGPEARISSGHLLTPERSALGSKVYGSHRPTGAVVDATLDRWSFSAAVFSSTTDGADNRDFNGWQDDVALLLGVGWRPAEAWEFSADLAWNHADAVGEDSVLDHRWAASLHAAWNGGPWGLAGDVHFGNNGGGGMSANPLRRGGFAGVVLTPHYWLWEERLQLVGQYQFAWSDAGEGLRAGSRYVRGKGSGGAGADVNSGYGDRHHVLYGGVNHHLCGHNAKFQGGLEWQRMDTPRGSFDALTWILAFRAFF